MQKEKILLENNLVAIPSSYEDNQNPSKPLSVSALTSYIIPACLFNTLATAVQMANSTPPETFPQTPLCRGLPSNPQTLTVSYSPEHIV